MSLAAAPSRKLAFISRDEFAALTLHDKNAYLQRLADQYATNVGSPPFELSKDGLARLRRFYMRRSFADLATENLPDNALSQVLRGLGETIKAADREKDVVGVIKSEAPATPAYSRLPDDAQLSFFVPAIYDAPIKDDMNLMDVAPFSLSKSRRSSTITYQLKDSIITISGSTEHGIATAFDYDIFIHMVSFLTEQMRQYNIDQKKGLCPISAKIALARWNQIRF